MIKDVADNGVPQETVEAVLHQFELDQREVSSGSNPYGLRLAGTILPIALHKGDPIAALDLDPLLNQLQEKIKNPDFIKSLARESLLENQHRVRTSHDAGHRTERENEYAGSTTSRRSEIQFV